MRDYPRLRKIEILIRVGRSFEHVVNHVRQEEIPLLEISSKHVINHVRRRESSLGFRD